MRIYLVVNSLTFPLETLTVHVALTVQEVFASDLQGHFIEVSQL